MKPETFSAYGYTAYLYELNGSVTWSLAMMGDVFKSGYVKGTSLKSRKLARYRAREAAKLEAEG